MNRWMATLATLCVVCLHAQAHFVWILPSQKAGERGHADLVFSDMLAPDTDVPVTKIGGTEVFSRGADGQKVGLDLKQQDSRYTVTGNMKDAQVIGGLTKYGVIQKGKAEPFLLVYHSKALIGWPWSAECCQPWHAIGFDIVPILQGAGPKMNVKGIRVFFQGKPLPGAEITLTNPDGSTVGEKKTDKEGYLLEGFDTLKHPGRYGVRANHKIAKPGESAGKKYAEERHYATLVFDVPAVPKNSQKEATPDPIATKLLAEARAARAVWVNFKGFNADLEANDGGKIAKGKLEVTAEGKVKLDLEDKSGLPWVKGTLSSLVNHRADNSGDRATPCTFADDNAHHPQGRTVKLLTDELHSSYRIKDKQILEVNRVTGDTRFTITVLENTWNADKKYLPASYVVHTWNLKTGELVKAAAFHDTWVRVGGIDLPSTLSIVNAGADKTAPLGARTIKLTNHKLLP